MSDTTKTGYVAIIGRPNVGKSTLLNHCLDTKLSITSRKPQTTRHQLLGILTRGSTQFLFIDTPGINAGTKRAGKTMQRFMNRQVLSPLADMDVILFLVEGNGFRAGDEEVLKYLQGARAAVICVLTKVDQIRDKAKLLPLIDEVSKKHEFKAIVPIAALRNEGLDLLLDAVEEELQIGPHLFSADEITDRPTSFLVAEMVREQLVRQLGDELPHRSTVVVERFEESETKTRIFATICIERDSQKRIVIGKGGRQLKAIGERARQAISEFLNQEVDLRLHVKVQARWTENQKSMAQLGYR